MTIEDLNAIEMRIVQLRIRELQALVTWLSGLAKAEAAISLRVLQERESELYKALNEL